MGGGVIHGDGYFGLHPASLSSTCIPFIIVCVGGGEGGQPPIDIHMYAKLLITYFPIRELQRR